jgi:protein-tyrosine-phosphatase
MRLEFGIDMSKHIAKHLNALDLSKFDVIVCLDNEVYGRLINKVPAEKLLDWHVEDPYYYYNYNVYVQCAHEIRNKLLTLKPNK